jgi:hypothetical protein
MLPDWLLQTALPWMRLKKSRRHILIGNDRAKYSMTPQAITQRKRNLKRGNGNTDAERREAGKRAADIRWGNIPRL